MKLAEIEGIGATYAAKLEEINTQKKLVRRVPAESEVTDWVQQAKNLPRIVSH